MKRFTETSKWSDPWFTELSTTAKLLWLYLLDNCDNSGVIHFNPKVAAVQIGQPVEEKHFTELGDRVKLLDSGKFWVQKFVQFQYGTLTPGCRPHDQVIELSARHGVKVTLSIPYVKGIHTPQDKDKDKDKKEGECEGKPTLDEVVSVMSGLRLPVSDAEWFWNKCEANGWTNNGRKIKSWKHTISSWKSAGYMPSQKTSSNGSPPGQLTLLQKIMNEIPG